jgi:hypothetical protein
MSVSKQIHKATLRRTDSPSDYVVVPTESKSESKGLAGKLSLLGGKEASMDMPGLNLPPAIQITPVMRHVFRYNASAGGNVNVTSAEVIGALGTICTVTNSTVRPWASSFRINSIKIWGSASSAAAQSERLFWSSGPGAQSRDWEVDKTVPEGLTVSGALVTRPPKGTLGALWQTSNAAILFVVALNVGSVLDMDVSFTLSNQFVSGTQTVATGVLGTIYYLYLDGSTSHTLVPVALPSTF